MSSRELVRWGGLSLLVGGMLTAIGIAVQSFEDPTSSLWTPTSLLQLFGSMLIVLAIPALYAVLARAIGWLGLVGYVLLFSAGLLGAIGGNALSLLVPYVAQNVPGFMTNPPPPVMQNYFMVVGLFELIGGVVFGAAIVRAGAPERFAGMLLILGSIVGFVGGIFDFLPHLGDLGTVLLVLALAWMGWTLMTRHVAEMAPSMTPAGGTSGAHARA